MMRLARATVIGALVVGSGLGVAACGDGKNDAISKQAQDQKGYVGGDGTVEELPAAKRADAVTLTGKTLDGKAWNVTQARGKVVVLNVWGAWCGPCQAEMPELQKAWSTYEKNGKNDVVFMGIDQRDSDAVAASTLKSRNVTYPSLANDDGQNLQGLQRKVAATPTTLVLDQKGRIAARVSGATTATTVRNMVDKVLAEKA